LRSFRVQVNDSYYTVSLDQTKEGAFQVALDGVLFEVETASNGGVISWLVRSDAENVRAKAMTRPNDRVDVWVACLPFSATVQAIGVGGYAVPTEIGPKTSAGRIRALMPGRITSILVKEEDEVKEGTPLLILEAMKMQNEISSPTNGKVKSIFVREGETVKKDSLLVLVE